MPRKKIGLDMAAQREPLELVPAFFADAKCATIDEG